MTVFADTYDTVSPAGGDDPTEADDRMRETKAAIQERENVDNYWPLTGTEVSDADTGEHRKLTIRTLSAVEVAALSAAKAYLYRLVTDGELYFKDASDNTIQLTDKGNRLANDTYFTATNEADDGSVDLIKAGKNEADNADVAIISDAARMASDAAPGEDTGVPNKKYVDDNDAMSVYVATNSVGGSLVKGVTYTTQSDGFIIAKVQLTGVGHQIIGTIAGVTLPVSESYSTNSTASIFFAVAAGSTFQIDSTSGTPDIRWMSQGAVTSATRPVAP